MKYQVSGHNRRNDTNFSVEVSVKGEDKIGAIKCALWYGALADSTTIIKIEKSENGIDHWFARGDTIFGNIMEIKEDL